MKTDERYTYCPFCDGRIYVGEPVVAVEHEDPFRALAHIDCKARARHRKAALERARKLGERR